MYTHSSTAQNPRAYCSFFYYNIFIVSEQVFLRFFMNLSRYARNLSQICSNVQFIPSPIEVREFLLRLLKNLSFSALYFCAFFGANKWLISVCSSFSRAIFLSIPPAYPVRLPFEPTTRWQGMIMEISLCPTAPPTACADI